MSKNPGNDVDIKPIPNTKEVDLGGATVEVTDDKNASQSAYPDIHVEPVHAEDMPKTHLHLHHAEKAQEVFDCTIIGGGTTGLFAAFYGGMREMSVKIIDSLGELGGQVSALYPEKNIYDVAGFPEIRGRDLVAGCVEQGLQFGPTVCLSEKVEHLRRETDGTYTLISEKNEHRARTVIIAAGVGAFSPRQLPSSPGFDSSTLNDLVGKQVFYFVKDQEQFRNKNLLIVGGGDSALDWALHLEPVATDITLIHRRDKWRAHEDTVQKVLSSSVKVRTFTEVCQVARGTNGFERVTIKHNKTGEESVLDTDAMILCLGFIANIGSIKDWGLVIEDGGVLVEAGTMNTSLPGVFAVGDVARYPGKMNLIATGFAEAAAAANQAKHFIDPESKIFPGHSSEK
jgi:thioredoxin reductase (NADPH)